MEVLPIEIRANGRDYRQVKRTDKKAMYISDDGVIEVFKVKIDKEGEIFGKKYPKREHYPTNEDFGKIAWCFTNMDRANMRYDSLRK